MKLIDIGCFNGDSVLHFVAYPEITQIEAYDPNDQFGDIWQAIKQTYDYVTFHRKAVWDKNGEVEYNQQPFDRPLGSTITKDKRDFNQGEHRWVECVDIADLVTEPCWLKLDVEGGEFDILERLIETDKLKWIERLYIEWHTGKMTKDYSEREAAIKQALRGKEVHTW